MERRTMIDIWAIGLIMLLGNAVIVNAISCSEALNTLRPCLSYLAGSDKSPSSSCCSGAKKLKDQAKTTEIRRELCKCFKKAANTFKIKVDKAKKLPDFCHVQTPAPVDPNIDCSKVKLY